MHDSIYYSIYYSMHDNNEEGNILQQIDGVVNRYNLHII